MYRSIWLKLFFFFVAVHLIAIYFQVDELAYCTKPLLLCTLTLWFLCSTQKNKLQKTVLAALLFSLTGDVLLIFQSTSASFFIYGLVSFLMAHIFYIIAFNIIRNQNDIGIKAALLLPITAYYFLLIYLLFTHLGGLKVPVMVYGIVISAMLFVALHLLYKRKKVNQYIVIGAILFVASDSLLAINKFYQAFELAGVLIMLTYSLAQYCIIKGMMNYLTKQPGSS